MSMLAVRWLTVIGVTRDILRQAEIDQQIPAAAERVRGCDTAGIFYEAGLMQHLVEPGNIEASRIDDARIRARRDVSIGVYCRHIEERAEIDAAIARRTRRIERAERIVVEYIAETLTRHALAEDVQVRRPVVCIAIGRPKPVLGGVEVEREAMVTRIARTADVRTVVVDARLVDEVGVGDRGCRGTDL